MSRGDIHLKEKLHECERSGKTAAAAGESQECRFDVEEGKTSERRGRSCCSPEANRSALLLLLLVASPKPSRVKLKLRAEAAL